ncbi:hypothetical protein CQW23_14190 [Capsicum baccatum]|uniref:Uncharacterized protein n=1 Tax=Capsicum baccatum TaxID=33114 RepID=A0A2G2WII2_CAPBA|nr:hypothetical protein CQW23_14190 [Capsicum baccatum]
MGKTRRKMEVVSPVPTDIVIANSVEPLHICEIAQELNIKSQHCDLYGKNEDKKSNVIVIHRCGSFMFSMAKEIDFFPKPTGAIIRAW